VKYKCKQKLTIITKIQVNEKNTSEQHSNSVIQTIHYNVGLKCFFFIFTKKNVFAIIVIMHIPLTFHKVVLRCIYGVVGCVVITLFQIIWRVCQWKNFENRSIIGEDMDKSTVACFLAHPVEVIDKWVKCVKDWGIAGASGGEVWRNEYSFLNWAWAWFPCQLLALRIKCHTYFCQFFFCFVKTGYGGDSGSNFGLFVCVMEGCLNLRSSGRGFECCVSIMRWLLGWVTDCRQVSHLCVWLTSDQWKLSLSSSRVDELSAVMVGCFWWHCVIQR